MTHLILQNRGMGNFYHLTHILVGIISFSTHSQDQQDYLEQMTYSIPSPVNEILNQIAPILLSKCSCDQIVIGGGTVFAAR